MMAECMALLCLSLPGVLIGLMAYRKARAAERCAGEAMRQAEEAKRARIIMALQGAVAARRSGSGGGKQIGQEQEDGTDGQDG